MATKRKAETQVPDGMKLCPKCKNVKFLEDFGRDSSDKSGRFTYCKKCERERRDEQAKKTQSILAANPDAFGTTCVCKRCNDELPRDEFYDRFTKKNGKHSYCITCMAAKNLLQEIKADKLCREWYQKHGGCTEPGCNEKNPKYLQGAHLDRKTKEDKPSHIRAPGKLKIEQDKCRPLCIEHHARSTAMENGKTRSVSIVTRHRLVRAEKQRLGKCARCPRIYDPTNPGFWHFDHLDPRTKLDDVSNMVKDCRPMEMITSEMEKCQMLCGNCHVDVTADRLQNKWQIWIDSLGKGTLEECLPGLATKWNMDEGDIEEIIVDKNYRREVFERAHGEKWVDFIQWN